MNSSPCAKFTTSMMPKINVSPDATSARIMPVTMPLSVWIRICSYGMAWNNPLMSSILHSQILVDDRVVHRELGRWAMMADGALLHDVHALARFQRERHVLLHQQDRHAITVQHVDDFPNL